MKKFLKLLMVFVFAIIFVPINADAMQSEGVFDVYERSLNSILEVESVELSDEEPEQILNNNIFSSAMTADVGDKEFYEVESNDYFELADVILDDYTVYGELYDTDLLDCYRFELPDKSSINIVTGATAQEFGFVIFSNTEEIIAAGLDLGVVDGVYVDALSCELDAGTYYIVTVDTRDIKDYIFYLMYFDYTEHTHVWDAGTISSQATCVTDGIRTYTCLDCGDTKTEPILALGHDYGTYYMTKEATCVVAGEEQRDCSRCSDKQTREIQALGHMPVDGYCTVCGKLGFNDINEGEYYYDAVEWAVNNGITNGYGSDVIFYPNGTCTRGQVVTFLWRAKGCPEPTAAVNPFTDIKESDYYYKAVLWAVENGITAGYGSSTIFNPDGACTRGQVATFLWRAEGQPSMSGTANPFTDVAADQYYYDAVLWAVANGVTNGYGGNTTFAPDVICNRGQIVTFLYRAEE